MFQLDITLKGLSSLDINVVSQPVKGPISGNEGVPLKLVHWVRQTEGLHKRYLRPAQRTSHS